MGLKNGGMWVVLAAVLGFAAWKGYKEYRPTPSSYAEDKIRFTNQNAGLGTDAKVEFGLDVVNNGRKDLANVPVIASCFTDAPGGEVPQDQTMDTGPIPAHGSVRIDGEAGPFPTSLYTKGGCTYKVTTVVFAD